MITCGEDLTKLNEGLTLTAKKDTGGKFELGFGCDYWDGVPVTAGQTCNEDEAEQQFEMRYAAAEMQAEDDLGSAEWAILSPQRRAVLADMAYEIGEGDTRFGTGLAGFQIMLAAVRTCKWQDAANALRNSRLFNQVPERENRNIGILSSGEWPLD